MSSASTIHYDGDQHAVLLLHGLSSSPLEIRFLARALHREGFTVTAPVMDRYSLDPATPDMHAWIDAALGVFDQLKAQYRFVSICGLSMGATLALALAEKRPTAQSVVLLSPTLDYDGWAIPWYRFLLYAIYYTPLRHRWRYRETAPFGLKNEALRAKIARTMESGDFSEIGPSTISLPALHHAGRLTSYVKKILPRIANDCLIIHAIDDETASPKNARLIAGQIRSTFQRLIFLDDSYHMVTVDNEREIVARETVVFLRESQTRASGEPENNAPIVSKALARRLRQLASRAT